MADFKKEVTVNIAEDPLSYSILIDNGTLDQLAEVLQDYYRGEKIFLVTDENVDRLYGKEVMNILQHNYQIIPYVLPSGEQAKSYKFLQKGYDRLIEESFHRDHLVLALGGGVVGDLAGFLAATYMRGISLVQIPTTLLAQVDSSVGGKTAINHPRGKNLIGAFYQPDLVFIDVDFLETLPLRELKTGLAEVIKHGLIADRNLFNYLENSREKIYNLNPGALIKIIYRSCQIKAGVVARDQKEQGERALLNFGHTMGHALEAVAGYGSYTHGEAVAVGLKVESRLSELEGHLSSAELESIERILTDYELQQQLPEEITADELYESMWHDKKVERNKINWILLAEIGEAFRAGEIARSKIYSVLEGLK